MSVNTVDVSDTEDLLLGYNDTDINTLNKERSESIEIKNKSVCFQLDPGAKCNVLPLKTFDQLCLKRVQLQDRKQT